MGRNTDICLLTGSPSTSPWLRPRTGHWWNEASLSVRMISIFIHPFYSIATAEKEVFPRSALCYGCGREGLHLRHFKASSMAWEVEALVKLLSNQKLISNPIEGKRWLICWESLWTVGGKLRNSKDLFRPQKLGELRWLGGLSAF